MIRGWTNEELAARLLSVMLGLREARGAFGVGVMADGTGCYLIFDATSGLQVSRVYVAWTDFLPEIPKAAALRWDLSGRTDQAAHRTLEAWLRDSYPELLNTRAEVPPPRMSAVERVTEDALQSLKTIAELFGLGVGDHRELLRRLRKEEDAICSECEAVQRRGSGAYSDLMPGAVDISPAGTFVDIRSPDHNWVLERVAKQSADVAAKFGPISSPHAALGVLMEEGAEFLEVVRQKEAVRDKRALANEAIDIAVAAVRAAADLGER